MGDRSRIFSSSMIVGYLDVLRVSALPYKADTPLLVDADGVLTLTVS